MNLQPLPQPELAAWIDAEGIEFEYESILHVNEWFKVHSTNKAINFVESGRAIRLAPGALNDYYLPKGTEPHNPDGLTPEQITEGGKYRAVTLEECDGRHGMDGSNCQEVWNSGRWLPAMLGKNLDCSYRVPITTPLPAVKESLTPQPATGQSKTPRVDEYADSAHMFDACTTVVLADFARTLETELTTALAERDEARRLLGEAETSLGIVISAVQEWCNSVDADSSWDGWDSDYKNMKWHVLPKEKEILQQITNHLKTA